jgi:hypothetical protein
MSSGWDKATKLAKDHAQQGGVFVKLANHGDKVVGAFVGEPHAREVVWTGERYEEFDAQKHAGAKPALRISFNFFVPAENAMKVIEGGRMWFTDVLKVRDKYGLEKWLFEIERHGEANSPKTTYSILPDTKVDDAMQERIAACALNDLEHLAKGGDEDDAADAGKTKSAPKPAAKTGPIDPRIASELVAKLKTLPKSEVDAFLKKFAVERVRDLKASDEAAARAFLDKASSGPEEVDPFA